MFSRALWLQLRALLLTGACVTAAAIVGTSSYGSVAPTPAVTQPPAPSGTVVATPTTTGCPTTAPLWHILYQVWEVGSDGTREPAATLTDAEANAAAFAALAGTSTGCALRVEVTVEDMGADMSNSVPADARSLYYDLVIERAWSGSGPGATADCFPGEGSMADQEPLYVVLPSNGGSTCGLPAPSYPDVAALMWALTNAHSSQYGYGLPNGQWSEPTHLAVTTTASSLTVLAGDASIASGVGEDLDFTGQRYGGAVAVAVATVGGQAVAHGAIDSGERLTFPRPLQPGSYRACLTVLALGRWQAAQKCLTFEIAGNSSALLHAKVSSRGLVLTPSAVLRGHTVKVQFLYTEPACRGGIPPTNQPCNGWEASSRLLVVLLKARTVVPVPPGWARRSQPFVTVAAPAFQSGGARYAPLTLSLPLGVSRP